MIKDGQIFCDSCNALITRVTEIPAEGWPQLHALCSNCFAQLGKKAPQR